MEKPTTAVFAADEAVVTVIHEAGYSQVDLTEGDITLNPEFDVIPQHPPFSRSFPANPRTFRRLTSFCARTL
jgi:hypothetical protein